MTIALISMLDTVIFLYLKQNIIDNSKVQNENNLIV